MAARSRTPTRASRRSCSPSRCLSRECNLSVTEGERRIWWNGPGTQRRGISAARQRVRGGAVATSETCSARRACLQGTLHQYKCRNDCRSSCRSYTRRSQDHSSRRKRSGGRRSRRHSCRRSPRRRIVRRCAVTAGKGATELARGCKKEGPISAWNAQHKEAIREVGAERHVPVVAAPPRAETPPNACAVRSLRLAHQHSAANRREQHSEVTV